MAAVPDFMSMYKSLIALPSVSCLNPQWDMSNEKVIQQLGQWLESLGFHVQIEPLASQPSKFNLLAHIGPLEAKGGLLLSGHTDTVPWDEGRWTRDPFSLTEADGKLYGLGSADMKGFFAFVLETLKNLDLTQLSKPIYILATADEETSMAGARELSKFPHLKPDYAIIGEPTSMTPVRMHKGHTTNCIRITGKSGHSSDPDAGVNAIDIMHDVLGELKTLRANLKDNYQEHAFKVPYPTMNFGHIHGGDAANRICACCELHMDMRPLPGMSVDLLGELLQQQLNEIHKRYPNTLAIEAMHAPIPGYQCPADSTLVKMAEKVSGAAAQPANYCTEAPFIDALGCETIVMGPGSINQAHQPDEFILLDEINPSLQKIERMIKELCFDLRS